MRNPDPRGRGQSELVGFLLIFSVVVLTIAIVGMTGFAGLDSARDFQRTANAEQAFIGLATNIDDVVREGAPSRATEIRIADASLSLQPANTTITITHENGTSNTTTVEPHSIVYDSQTGTSLSYRSGAVIRRDGESAVLVREPGFVLTDDEVILPVVNASPERGGTVGGSTAVTVVTRTDGTRLIALGRSASNVTLRVSSRHAEVWERYFAGFEGDGPVVTVTRDGDTVAVTIATDRVYVVVHRIAVAFQ